jgi:hypothetical protein
MIAAGICVGFLVPLTKYPRLGVSAHIHFLMEGMMVLSAGVLLYIAPLQAHKSTRCLGDTLSRWQVKLIYWAFALSWPLLVAEVFNGWWGTRQTLPTAADAANVGEKALWWQEFIMSSTHYVSALPQVAVVSTDPAVVLHYASC